MCAINQENYCFIVLFTIKCENGWVPFQKNCYYFSRNSKLTFKDAVVSI